MDSQKESHGAEDRLKVPTLSCLNALPFVTVLILAVSCGGQLNAVTPDTGPHSGANTAPDKLLSPGDLCAKFERLILEAEKLKADLDKNILVCKKVISALEDLERLKKTKFKTGLNDVEAAMLAKFRRELPVIEGESRGLTEDIQRLRATARSFRQSLQEPKSR